MPRAPRLRTISASLLLIAAGAAPAASQTPSLVSALQGGYSSSSSSSPHRPFVAPEIKFTTFEGRAGAMVGGYIGTVQEGHMLFGLGLHTLLIGGEKRGLTFGGLVGGWVFNEDARVTAVIKGTVGFGKISALFGQVVSTCPPGGECVDTLRVNELGMTFMGVEPDGSVAIRLKNNLRLTAGFGYRFGTRANTFDPNPSGPTGSVAIHFVF